MTGWKKFAAIGGLLFVIILAATWIIKSRSKSTTMPSEIRRQYSGVEVERIDRSTFELVKMTDGEWQKLGHKNNNYKNPKTGTFSMAMPIKCASCGQQIPLPDFPPNVDIATRFKMVSEYVCPRCGKKASSK